MLQQLVQRNPIISDDVMSLYYRLGEQNRPTLNEMSKLLQLAVRRFSKVFIFIDALDECPEVNGTRESFLAEIRKLQQAIYLLVTSRHILAIEREFKLAEKVEIRASSEHVNKYLTYRIESESRLTGLLKNDTALQALIVSTVAKNTEGMFLLAQLQMDSLARKLSRRDIRKALENLPKELGGTYEEAVERIGNQNKDDAKLAQRVLCWVSHSLRPLTIIEVQHAIAAEYGDEDFDGEAFPNENVLISVCAGLVTIDQQSKIIRLVHYTTQEYFERNRVTQFPHAQTSIAMACVVYISFNVFESYCRNDKELKIRMQKYPFLGYAAMHWGDHARGDPEGAIKEQALTFLMNESKVMCYNQVRHHQSRSYFSHGEDSIKGVNGLHLVASLGLVKIVCLLLDRGFNANSEDSSGRTLLLYALSKDHEAVVKLLLEKGAELEIRSDNGRTLLAWAARKGHEAIMKLLLEKNAELETKIDSGMRLLSMAASSGHVAVVKLLHEKRSQRLR